MPDPHPFRPAACRWAAGLLLGLLLGLSGLAAQAAQLVIAVGENSIFAPLQLAAQEGYFAAEGLDVKVITCVNGRRCLKHLTDGEAHVATVADTPMVFALHAGHRFDIVATFGTSAQDSMIVARTDRGIRSAGDLAGKRLGVVRGTSSHYFANVFLLVNGVTRDTVNIVFIDPNAPADPLVHGDIDAAALYRPAGPQAVQQLGAKARVLPTQVPYTVMVNLVAQPGLSQDNLVRVLRATRRGIELLNSQPARAQAMLAAHWQTDAKTTAERLAGYDWRLGLSQNLLSTLEAESRWALREDLVDRSNGRPDYLELMRVEPLRSLDPRAVTLVK
jgi:ABC-type nitrate/sulfonate/bicarbonate transport system substrate-binding protein